MIALRFVSSLFLLAAAVSLVSELTRAQLGLPGAPFTPLLAQLTDAAPATLAAVQRAVRGATHPLVWDPLIRSVLLLPAWLLLGAAGLLVGWLGRRRPRSTDVFTN